ncbi:MAG: hypothetical protein IKI69_05230 [Oscillospiraceae bacterium]|nr:hypothetical protein [Oscillospiraceae bacterium]
MNLLFFLIILFVGVGVAIISVGLLAYNRRANKIARGEIHDRHSQIPDPGTTLNAVYRVVLMVFVVIALINISTLHENLNSMQHSINLLRSNEHELYVLQDMVEQNGKRVESVSLAYSDLNADHRTGTISFTASLKEYSEDTTVTLQVSGQSIALDRIAPGTYGTSFTADLFQAYTEPKLHIVDGDKTVVEPVYGAFPEWIFWDFLPMPGLQSNLSFVERFGKVSYQGDYYICAEHLEDIEAVSLTYLSGGRELKTIDVTEETLNHEAITLEKGLKLERDLSFRIELVTKSGFKIVDQSLRFGRSVPPGADGFTQIQDLQGNILWDVR